MGGEVTTNQVEINEQYYFLITNELCVFIQKYHELWDELHLVFREKWGLC